MEDCNLLSKYEHFKAFAQFEQIFQIADDLLSNQGCSKPLNENIKPLYEKSKAPAYLFRSVLESSEVGIVCVDSAGKVTYFNPKFVEIWGIPPGVLTTQKFSQYVAYCQTKAKNAEGFCSYVEAVAESPNAAGLRTVALKNGKAVQQAFQPQSYVSLPDASSLNASSLDAGGEYDVSYSTGRVWGYLETAQIESDPDTVSDILTPGFLSWASATSNLVFIVCDGRLAYANTKAQEVLGYSEPEIIEQAHFQRWAAHLSQHSTEQGKIYKLADRNNQDLWLQSSGRSFRLGNKPWVVISAIDITAIRQKELDVLELFSREKAINQKRHRLSEVITHRLINSLSYISMVTDSIEMYYDQWDDDKRKNYTNRLRENAQRVHQCTNRLSELCQLATDELSSCLSSIDAYEVCWSLTEEFKKLYPQHAFVSLTVASSTWVSLDENLLRAILFNLLENASQYSPSGSLVKLSFSHEATCATFKVHDKGMGVVTAECSKLVQPFYRGSNSSDGTGLGLGLAIVKALLEVQGGWIEFDNNFEKGTIVSVSFPLSQHAGDAGGDRSQWYDYSSEPSKSSEPSRSLEPPRALPRQISAKRRNH